MINGKYSEILCTALSAPCPNVIAFFDFEYTVFQVQANNVLVEMMSITSFSPMKEVLTFGYSQEMLRVLVHQVREQDRRHTHILYVSAVNTSPRLNI